MKLEIIKKEWEQFMVIPDPWIVDVILATLIGNAIIDRGAVWVMITAKSSGGKTTLMKPINLIRGVYFLDDLTEKTLLSGFKIKGKESSLLNIIGNGTLAFSDFTSVMSKNPVSRGEILGQLRLVHDGEFNKSTGNSTLKWKGKIGFIGASTNDIYFHLEQGRSMGERFIFYAMNQPSDADIADKQSSVSHSPQMIQDIMAPMYRDYSLAIREWVDVNGLPPLIMTAEQREKINQAVMFCVNGKATVHTNYKTGKSDQMPNKAGVGRDLKMFHGLLHSFQVMDAYEHENPNYPLSDERVKIIMKCAYSSLNRERRKVLEILADATEELSASKIGLRKGFGLEKEAVEMYLNPLYAVGLVKKTFEGNTFKWSIKDEKLRKFVKEVSEMMDQEEHDPVDEVISVISDVQRRLEEEFPNEIKKF